MAFVFCLFEKYGFVRFRTVYELPFPGFMVRRKHMFWRHIGGRFWGLFSDFFWDVCICHSGKFFCASLFSTDKVNASVRPINMDQDETRPVCCGCQSLKEEL